MLKLFNLFLEVALLKKGPQDVPYSVFLFVAVIVFMFGLDFALSRIPDYKGKVIDIGDLMVYLVMANAILFAFIYLLFSAQKKAARFVQSLTALNGAESIIKMVHIPILIAASNGANQDPSFIFLLAGFFQFGILAWDMLLYFHIFRQSLNVSGLMAGFYSFVFMLLSLILYIVFIPGEA